MDTKPATQAECLSATEGVALAEEFLERSWVRQRKLNTEMTRRTRQTPQVHIDGISQNLVSLVTGHPGSLSAARGSDIKMGNRDGEVKGCTKVDQLGKCRKCKGPVPGTEDKCGTCGSDDIKRNNDSHWVILVNDADHLTRLLDQEAYFFVLFDGIQDVDVSVFRIGTDSLGFRRGLENHLATRNDKSRKFNLHPYSPRFLMMKPYRIFQAQIIGEHIRTILYPGRDAPVMETFGPLQQFYNRQSLTSDLLNRVAAAYGVALPIPGNLKPYEVKRQSLAALEEARRLASWPDDELADRFADAAYPEQS